MKMKCEICGKETEIPDDKYDPDNDLFCSQACEEIATENLVRSIFGVPEVDLKQTKKEDPGPTLEELEFLQDEMALMVKNHRLEKSYDAMNRLFVLTHEMIERGIVEESPEGIQKAWDAIFENEPEMKVHYEKFVAVFFEESLKKTDQENRPN